MTYQPANTESSFIPATEYFPPDDAALRLKLTDIYSKAAAAINLKEIALYEEFEQLTGKQFYNPADPQKRRNGFRRVFSFGAIAAGATLPITHGIKGIVQTTFIGGCCTTAIDSRSVPYASVANVNQQIEIQSTPTQIIITNGAAAPAITSGYVSIEYLKN